VLFWFLVNSVTGTDQEKEAILCALMAKCSVFIRNCGGYTVLDKLAANVPVSQLKGALKAHMKALLKQSEGMLQLQLDSQGANQSYGSREL